MTGRERIKAAINYQKPDKVPVHEDFWEDTIYEWRKQGMSKNITEHPKALGDTDFMTNYFDFDILRLFLDTSPRYEMKILENDGEFYTFEDRYGYTARKTWKKSGSIHYVKTETNSKEDWENVKAKWINDFDAEGTARIDDRNYFEHFDPYPSWQEAEKKFKNHLASGRYILVTNYGPWEGTWRHRSLDRLLLDIALEPDWVIEMMKIQTDMTIKVLEKMISSGITPDGYLMVDDIGSSRGPLISPDMWRKIIKPFYVKTGEWLFSHDIDFWLHSCGNSVMLFPEYLECGIQVINPLQVMAGIDIRELKKQFGHNVAWYGNIDAHMFGKDVNNIISEVNSRIECFPDGGFIAHSDHSIPPAMPLKDFQYYLDWLRNKK